MEELKVGAILHIVLESGNFTDNGNFSAYDESGTRYHVHKRMCDALNWKENTDVVFPLYSIASVKEIGTQLDTDADGEFNGPKVNRLAVTKIYATRDDYIKSQVDKQTTKIEIAKGVSEVAVSAGLTEDAVKALVTASI